MIDYEKLKHIHCMAERYSRGTEVINITVSYSNGEPSFWLSGSCIGETDFDTLDDLIAYLSPRVALEPKFKVGQEVWFFSSVAGRIIKAKVESHPSIIDKRGTSYFLGEPVYASIFERSIHPTREALIHSQIEHWQNMLKGGEAEECEHESDGSFALTHPLQFKCKKCGGCYR